jgi:magnesium-transporting ATPase (P-type)
MISGDNTTTARAVAKQVGIPESNVIAGVLPQEKVNSGNSPPIFVTLEHYLLLGRQSSLAPRDCPEEAATEARVVIAEKVEQSLCSCHGWRWYQ